MWFGNKENFLKTKTRPMYGLFSTSLFAPAVLPSWKIKTIYLTDKETGQVNIKDDTKFSLLEHNTFETDY